MSLATAFILVSAVAYFWCLMPKRLTDLNIIVEKTSFLICGILLASNLLIFHNQYLWLIFGFIWTLMALASYFGLVHWQYEDATHTPQPNPTIQATMFAWDLGIAVASIFLSQLI